MKNALSLAPSSALRVFCFDDIDQYRSCVDGVDLEITPLTRQISTQQFIVSLPGCDLVVERTFPRLVDAKLMPDRTLIGFSMCDELSLQINGVDLDAESLVRVHGGAICVARENAPICFASLLSKYDISGRGWPATGKTLDIFTISGVALRRLRLLVREVLTFASQCPDDIQKPEVAEGIIESLFAAVDEAFVHSVSMPGARAAHAERFLDIVIGIDQIISANSANPIYSGELGSALGVSVRTIHTAVLQYRGMSLHRYLKLKRLWQVRHRLLSGNISIKACALAYGFWHLSDFSRSYRVLFGELPSETLARANLKAGPGGD